MKWTALLARTAQHGSVATRTLVHIARRHMESRGLPVGFAAPEGARVGAGAGEDEVGVAIAAALERMGPVFIKLGQVLSARPDIVPPWLVRSLARLRDDVSPVAAEDIIARVEAELGHSYRIAFSSFEPVPIAVGSVAQVHRAVLRNGAVVAVKVRRPGALEAARMDLRIIEYMARALEKLPGFTSIPFLALTRELTRALEAQFDLSREALDMIRVREGIRDRTEVVIPRVHTLWSTQAMLTMDYIDGLVPVDAIELSERERVDLARSGLHAVYDMLFLNGLMHADLHPGNVFFLPGPRIVLLDFGLVATLAGRSRGDFRDFFRAMATNDGATCARIVLDTAEAVGGSRDAFTRDMVAMVDRFAGLAVEDFEVAGFAVALFDTQRKHRVRGSADFTMTIVSLAVFEGILKTLHPGMDFQHEAQVYLDERTRC